MTLKVLLLEDQDFQRESISGLLKTILPEPKIETADTYDSAKSLWENDEWNFVVLDINIKSASSENSFDGNSLYEEIVSSNSTQQLAPVVVRYTGDINVLQSLNIIVKKGHIIKKGEDDLKNFRDRFRNEENERFEKIKNEFHTINPVVSAINELKDLYVKELQLAYSQKKTELIDQISNTVIFKDKYTLRHVFPVRLKKIISGSEVVKNLGELKDLLEGVNLNLKLNEFFTSNYDVLHASVTHNNEAGNWRKFVESETKLSLQQLSNLLPEQKKSGINLKTETLNALYKDKEIPNPESLAERPPWKDLTEDVWTEIREDFKDNWKHWNKNIFDGESLNENSIPQKILSVIKTHIDESQVSIEFDNHLTNQEAEGCYIFRPLIDWFIKIFTLESFKILSDEKQSAKSFYYSVYKSECGNSFNIALAHNGTHPNTSEIQNFLKEKNSSWYNFQELQGWAIWELWIKDFESNEWKVIISNVEEPLSENDFSTDVFQYIVKEKSSIITKLKFEKK